MGETNKERELQQWLDEALERYSATEPRVGLEGRVLAQLQAEKSRVQTKNPQWWWAIGAATAVAAIVVTLWVGLTSGRTHVPERSHVIIVEHKDAGATANLTHPVVVVRQPRVNVRKQVSRPVRAENDRSPKLDQFPSPQPLSEQETMLARYVAEFPERALLVARAQTELRKQDEREMAGPSPRTGSATNLDQPE